MTEPAVRDWQPGAQDAITDVPGISVGHWTDRRAATGCTVILCPSATAAAVDARGGAPGTRETDVLSMANTVRRCHAILFTGGSAFGLAAADGVMRWLAEQGAGFETKHGSIPIVSGAVIFDLGIGPAGGYPGSPAGYDACKRASSGPVPQGSVGAGTGATVAKMLGPESVWKGGLGTASLVGPRGLVVGALAVVNAFGAIIDPDTAEVVAAPTEDGVFVPLPEAAARAAERIAAPGENTTLVCVATNASLAHHEVQRVAMQAHDGLARTIVPVHTFADGDVAFAVSMGTAEATPGDALLVSLMAMRAVELAVLRGVNLARAIAGVRSVNNDLEPKPRPRRRG